MILEGLCPEEQEWLARKAALAGGLSRLLKALLRQGMVWEAVYRDMQANDEIQARLKRRGVLARDARRRARARRVVPTRGRRTVSMTAGRKRAVAPPSRADAT